MRSACARSGSISTGGEPRYRVEFERSRGACRRSGLEGPIGLDGLARSTEAGAGGVLAVKGRWLDDDTFEIVSHSVDEGVVTPRPAHLPRARGRRDLHRQHTALVVRVHGQRAD